MMMSVYFVSMVSLESAASSSIEINVHQHPVNTRSISIQAYLHKIHLNVGSLPEMTVSQADWWANPIEFPARQVYSPASSMVTLDRYSTSTSDMFKLPAYATQIQKRHMNHQSNTSTPCLACFLKVIIFSGSAQNQPWVSEHRVLLRGCSGSRFVLCVWATECEAGHRCRPYSVTGHQCRPPLWCLQAVQPEGLAGVENVL